MSRIYSTSQNLRELDEDTLNDLMKSIIETQQGK